MGPRINSISREETGTTNLPKNNHRSYFFVVFTEGLGTVEFGKGGGKIPITAPGHYCPPIAPTTEIDIESVDGTYVIHEA